MMDSQTEQLDVLEGERGIPSVNSVATSRWKRGAVLLVMLATLGVGASVAVIKFGNSGAEPEPVAQRTMTTASTVPPRTFVDVPNVEPEPAPVQSMAPVSPIVPVALPTSRQIKPVAPLKPKPSLDKASSRSIVVDNRANSGAQTASAPTVGQASQSGAGGLFGGAGGQETGELSSSLKPTKLTATSANVLGNRNFMITRGAFIDCALSTRLDSTVPGLTSCVVTRDVFSSNGKLVLVERGSTVTGEYRSNLQQGMSRIFVLWTRIQTPKGVIINLDSPATDSLGATGISGHVDNHFWKRFGGAMLLSLVDDAARAASTSQRHSENTQIVLNSAGGVSSDLAAEVLRNTINIPPTLYANQGARVGIFVARDLDFSEVYDVAPQ